MTSSTKKNFFFSTLLLSFLLFMGACDTELEPDDTNQSSNPNSPVSVDPEKASEYLKLVNATKVTGEPPQGVEGDIWIDVKDTIFLMLGVPVGDRVSFLHDPKMNVTGFFVYVPGASYYYDIPSIPKEGKDSTDVVYIDVDFPVADFKDYPISFPIHLMPYVDGIPFKTFIKQVTIEDPKDPDEVAVCNTILSDVGVGNARYWQWEFTIRLYNNEIRNFWAPGVRVGLNVLLGGCCTDKGKSISATDPGGAGCRKISPSPGFTWVEFPSNAGQTSLWEWMSLSPDNTIEIHGAMDEAAIVPDTRNFCDSTVDLVYNKYLRNNVGTQYFTPGTLGIRLDFPNMTKPNISFLQGGAYGIDYTCNSLIFTRGNREGEEWGYVYKRLVLDELTDFELEWYTYDNHPLHE